MPSAQGAWGDMNQNQNHPAKKLLPSWAIHILINGRGFKLGFINWCCLFVKALCLVWRLSVADTVEAFCCCCGLDELWRLLCVLILPPHGPNWGEQTRWCCISTLGWVRRLKGTGNTPVGFRPDFRLSPFRQLGRQRPTRTRLCRTEIPRGPPKSNTGSPGVCLGAYGRKAK